MDAMVATKESAQPQADRSRWRVWHARRWRIVTGFILLTYLSTHFLNHAAALISLEAVEAGRDAFLLIWRNPLGTTLLYGALLIHFGLALYALYARRRLADLSVSEWVQLLLGLTVPFLLAKHALGTRMLHEFYGVEDNYLYEFLVLWTLRPDLGIQQVVLFVFAWSHGCIGAHYYLRLKRWYPRALPYLFGGALVLPVLGLLGFVVGGRAVAELAESERWRERLVEAVNWPDEDAVAAVQFGGEIVWATAAILIALTLFLRSLRFIAERQRGTIRVRYPDGRVVESPPGPTVLEFSNINGIPHASVCGGRGRCSTCRIRLGAGAARVPPPDPAEQAVLKRVGAPPNMRLACQLRPQADLEVEPLLPPNIGPRAGRARPDYLQGRERELVILFADLRAFTRFAEHKLPYDVVFVLNRYFRAMGTAIEGAGGHLDKFIGDGVMALFGIETDASTAANQALAAARDMAENLADLNRSLESDLDEPLRIGIGIHVGAVIVGEMGYAHATLLTAIGDAVNTASRLEAMTKELGCQLVVSEKVVRHAGIDAGALRPAQVAIRGRRDPLDVRVIEDARHIRLAADSATAPSASTT